MDSFILREEDYAIRIMVYLATEGKMVKIKDICSSLYLSRPIVVKIINKLKSCGFLITKTGKEGGLTITEKALDVSLYDVLQCMGFDTRVNQCLNHNISCQLMPICKVNVLFAEIENDIIGRLMNAKIKDFIFNNKDIKLVN